jgi:iron complex outermembrane recepter protein
MPAKGEPAMSALVSAVALAAALTTSTPEAPASARSAAPDTPVPAVAPDTPAAPDGTETILLWHPARPDTIVVRGLRREVTARTTSTTSVSPSAAPVGVDDLPALLPGVWLVNDQDPGTNILSLRGATTDRLQQASVAMIVDGVPLGDTELFTGPLFDTAAISVLRGPQGALFGKNAAGGAIILRTHTGLDPTQFPEAPDYLSVTLGDGGLRRLEFGASGGADHSEQYEGFAVRLAGLYTAHDGWIRNRTLDRLVDGQELAAARLTGSWKGALAGGDGAFEARLNWMEERGGAAWASSGNVTGLAGGRLDGAILTDPIGDYEGRAWRTWTQGSLQGTWSPGFMAGSVRFLAARDVYAKRWREELDYRPGPLTFFGAPLFPDGLQPISQPIDLDIGTYELVYRTGAAGSADDGGLTLGVFRQDVERRRTDDFGPLLFGAPAPAYATTSTQTAVFVGLALEGHGVFGGDWWIDLQGRQERDERSQVITTSTTGAVVEARRQSFSRFQPRLAAAWEISVDGARLRLRASWAEAFRPGGFNPQPGPGSIWQPVYAPEITTSAELGAALDGETSLAGLPANWNVALSVYANEIGNFQNYTFIDGQSVTLSVPSVSVDGFELGVGFDLALPRWDLGLRADYAFNDARLGRFIATDPLLGNPATRDYTGRQVPNAPRSTGSLTIDVAPDRPITGWEPAAALTLHHAGRTVYELDNVLFSPARTWLDLRLSARLAGDFGDGWEVRLDVRNLTDERWAVSAFGQGMLGLLAGLGPGGPFDTFTINRGRQVSMTLRREF